MKSERLKKLEVELQDLQQWLKLGLVPKKDLDKHKIEIQGLVARIDEEKDRLKTLKENGDGEEYTMPKRSPQSKQPYQEAHSIPDIDMEDDYDDSSLNLDTESYEVESSSLFDIEEGAEERSESDEEEDEDPFSDRSRWKRGILEDPDANEW
jgi:hypothetical protein